MENTPKTCKETLIDALERVIETKQKYKELDLACAIAGIKGVMSTDHPDVAALLQKLLDVHSPYLDI